MSKQSKVAGWQANPLCTTDLEFLRNELADRFDIHPPEEWSAPLIAAMVGLFDAHTFHLTLQAREARAGLRVVS